MQLIATILTLKWDASRAPALTRPRSLELSPRYASDAEVQETKWTDWGDNTAYGHGVIRDTMGMGSVIAHVTLTVTDGFILPGCTAQYAGMREYRELHATFKWKPDPAWNRADRQESRALSGNLAGETPC